MKEKLLEEEVERIRQAHEAGMSYLDKHGREIPSGVPVEVPIRFRTPQSTREVVADLVRRELSQRAQDEGFETWEEADDFDIEDDPVDPRTEYERVFDFPATDLDKPLHDANAPNGVEPGGAPTPADSGSGTSKPAAAPANDPPGGE